MEYSKECTQVYFILIHLEKEIRERIPQRVIDILKENSGDTIVNYELDFIEKDIYEIPLSQTTKDLLAFIYQKYLCNFEERTIDISNINSIEEIFEKRRNNLPVKVENNKNENIIEKMKNKWIMFWKKLFHIK